MFIWIFISIWSVNLSCIDIRGKRHSPRVGRVEVKRGIRLMHTASLESHFYIVAHIYFNIFHFPRIIIFHEELAI